MGYMRPPGDISPGDILMITYHTEEDVEIDFADAERDSSDLLASQAIIIAEVTRVIRVEVQEKEE